MFVPSGPYTQINPAHMTIARPLESPDRAAQKWQKALSNILQTCGKSRFSGIFRNLAAIVYQMNLSVVSRLQSVQGCMSAYPKKFRSFILNFT